MDYLILLIGLSLLLAGANTLVDASVAIAKKAHLSNFIIGFTIVGIGTSAPEFFISLSSAITGHGDMAIGNAIGSNICNVFLILGATGIILPFAIERQQTRRDIPFAIIVSVLFTTLALTGTQTGLSRIDGVILFALFIIYMAYMLISGKKNEIEEEETTSKYEHLKTFTLVLIAIASLCAMLGGGTLFLDSAESIARNWGVSESVISITIVAVGTSLPELITCIIAARKKDAQLALGNVLGSNIFNILFVLGLPAIINPINAQSIALTDYFMLLFSAVACFIVVFTFGKHRFDRIEGIIFLLIYLGYDITLFLR